MKTALFLAPLALLAIPLTALPASSQTVVIKPGPGVYRGAYGPGMRRDFYRPPVMARRDYAPGRTVTRTTTRTNRAGVTTTRSVTRTTR